MWFAAPLKIMKTSNICYLKLKRKKANNENGFYHTNKTTKRDFIPKTRNIYQKNIFACKQYIYLLQYIYKRNKLMSQHFKKF